MTPANPDPREERREAAATRRRWVNLAELVAVAGVVIAALSLWLTWSQNRADKVQRSEAAQEAAKKERFVAKGAPDKDGASVVLASDDEHSIGDVRFTFPTALGVGPHDAEDNVFQRDWIAKPLLKLTDGGADDRVGRLPVFVAYRYTDAEGEHRATGIYDVVWKTEGRTVFGRKLTITGFRLRRNGGSATDLDRLWTRL